MNLLNLIKAGPANKFTTNKLTLAALLEVLDGVMEMDGRMLVVTTNYPDRLDKALIRPGRIDMKVRFGPCTRTSILQMFKHYFEMEVPQKFDSEELPEASKWTPAEVTQVFLNNMEEPMEALKYLVEMHGKVEEMQSTENVDVNEEKQRLTEETNLIAIEEK